jgi:hypothetical protein
MALPSPSAVGVEVFDAHYGDTRRPVAPGDTLSNFDALKARIVASGW